MLDTVKKELNVLPSSSFSDFYQDYVAYIEESIIQHDVKKAYSVVKSIDNIPDVIRGLNKLTEELNQ